MLGARLKTLWILAASLLVAGGAAIIHWRLATPVYEAQTCLLIPRGRDGTAIQLGQDGALETAVLEKAAESLQQHDVSFLDQCDVSRERMEKDLRGRVIHGGGSDEVTFQLRTAHPDLAVPILRTVTDCWLAHLGRPLGKDAPQASREGLERIELALSRQKEHLKTLEATDRKSDTETAALRRQVELKRAGLAEIGVDRDESREVLAQLRSTAVGNKSLEELVERLPNPIVRNRAWDLLRRIEQEQELRSQQILQARFQTVYGRNHPRLKAVVERISAISQSLGEAPLSDKSPLARLIAVVGEHSAELDAQYAAVETELAAMEGNLQKHAEKEKSVADARAELLELERAQAAAVQKFASARDAAPPIEILQPPTLSMTPVWPVLWHHAAASLGAGLALGLFLARRTARQAE